MIKLARLAAQFAGLSVIAVIASVIYTPVAPQGDSGPTYAVATTHSSAETA